MNIARILENRIGPIVTCAATATVEEAGRKLAAKRIGAMPVIEGGLVTGIFSERDLLNCVAKEGADGLSKRVGHVMTAPAITVDPQLEIIEALALMTRRRIRHLPVLQAGALIGFISIGDLVKFRVDEIETEAEQMREYIQMA